jgi:hypothetical protein
LRALFNEPELRQRRKPSAANKNIPAPGAASTIKEGGGK